MPIPTLRAGSCQIWWARTEAGNPPPLLDPPGTLDPLDPLDPLDLLDLLDDDEHARHARFLRADDRARFLVAHALVRIVAARHVGVAPREIRYAHGASHSKPRFAGPAEILEASISHSAERVVVAVSRGVELGVDVERVAAATQDDSLAESVLCPDEQRELRRSPEPSRAWALCRYWTRKEAILKATGHGLSISPRRIAVTPPTRPPALVSWSGLGRPLRSVHVYDLDADAGYAASLATIGLPLQRSEHDGSTLLAARR